MPRLGVTLDEVLLAADQIHSQGVSPTIEKIRQIIGAGSNTTISKYLNTWKEKKFNQKENNYSKPVTSDLVKLAAEKVWQQIREEADIEINKIKENSNQIVNEAQNKERLAKERSDALQDEITILRDQFHELQGAKEILSLDFKKLREEHVILQERYKGLDERYTDFQRITLQHQEDMSQANKKEIDLLIEKSQLKDDANKKLISELKNHNENQRQHFIVEIDSIKTKNQQLQKESDNTLSKIKTREIETAKLNTELNAVTKERDQLIAQLESQKKYFSILDKNMEMTSSILSEVKEIPKIDFILPSIGMLTEANNHFFKLTNETQSILDTFNKKIKELGANDE